MLGTRQSVDRGQVVMARAAEPDLTAELEPSTGGWTRGASMSSHSPTTDFSQGVPVEYAGVGRRFVAVLIDLGVFFVIGLLAGGAYSTSDSGTHRVGVEAGGWWPFLIFIGYYVVLEALTGKTIGKLVMGLRVVAEDGDAISWGQALGRNLLRLVDALFFYFIAAIFVWSSSKRQRLGDRAANTFVILDRGERRERARVTPIAFEEPQPVAAADNTTYTHERFLEDLARAKRVSE